MQCGSCDVAPLVPILMNPLVWLSALAAVSLMVDKGKKIVGKGKK